MADGQSCFDTVNVRQRGNRQFGNGQVIVPRSNFTCNGRVTGYVISLESVGDSGGYPSVQVWHHINSSFYIRVHTECPITGDDIELVTGSQSGGGNDYYLGAVSCTEKNRIEFQSGDVIGYHQGDSVLYQLWSINSNVYISYHRDANSPLNTFDISNDDGLSANAQQPLIQVMYGMYVCM